MNAGPLLSEELITDPRTSTHVGDRVTPKKLLEGPDDFPQIVYHRISSPHTYTHDGDSGLLSPRYQLDVWAKDPDTADEVADAAIEVLSGRTVAGIAWTAVIDDRDDHESATGLFRRIVDVMPHLEN